MNITLSESAFVFRTINAGKSKRNEDQAVVHVGLLTRPIKLDSSNSQSGSSQEKSSCGKSEPVINGHGDETEQSTREAQEHTVVLSPQGSTLSASPATELKEDYYEATSNLQDSSSNSGPGRIRIEQSNTVHNTQEETQPSQLSNSPPSQPSIPKQPLTSSVSLPYYLFGVFDGHAGWGAAVAAANQLHHIIHVSNDFLLLCIPNFTSL